MSWFSNFAISFTIISILSGTLTLSLLPGPELRRLRRGGLRLAARFLLRGERRPGHGRDRLEVPDRGGLYYWSSKMGGPAWGWFTGWFNLMRCL